MDIWLKSRRLLARRPSGVLHTTRGYFRRTPSSKSGWCSLELKKHYGLRCNRKPGQGGDADRSQVRDLRAELLAAEAAHFAKINGGSSAITDIGDSMSSAGKRQLGNQNQGDIEGDLEAKRRRILEETRDIDADSDGGSEEDSSEDDRFATFNPSTIQTDCSSDDEEDETAELQRELEKIKRERAEKREQEVTSRVYDVHGLMKLTICCRKKKRPLKKRLQESVTSPSVTPFLIQSQISTLSAGV
jgi:Cwf15/Cwc15 cell cycle control protein